MPLYPKIGRNCELILQYYIEVHQNIFVYDYEQMSVASHLLQGGSVELAKPVYV